MPLISRATSPHKAWTKLATIYVNQSQTRIMDLKITLLRLPKAQNLSEYMQIVQIIKDELAIINVPIDESDLTSRVLRNLSLDFKEISVAILSRDTSITFAELHNRLVEHEGFLKLEEKHWGILSLLTTLNIMTITSFVAINSLIRTIILLLRSTTMLLVLNLSAPIRIDIT